MSARAWLQIGLLFLAAGDVAIGIWAYGFPHAFYNGLPTVNMMPPYNRHFVSDVGAFFISQGIVMGAAAIFMEHRIVCVALAGYLTFAVLHAIFHASQLSVMPLHDVIGLSVALAFDIAMPAVLLGLATYVERGRTVPN